MELDTLSPGSAAEIGSAMNTGKARRTLYVWMRSRGVTSITVRKSAVTISKARKTLRIRMKSGEKGKVCRIVRDLTAVPTVNVRTQKSQQRSKRCRTLFCRGRDFTSSFSSTL